MFAIRQLILNLVINAIEASSKAGIVTIKTFQKDGTTNLVIRDQACGISPTIINKEPLSYQQKHKAQGSD
ncbi:MAG: Histidine kinase, gyrase and HSP90-like ATPase [Firmicutes bacterium]|jgi:signal transduction histidine kinase|nr:Histidine kinase, gyrase and HSP90-like ATPase [Bacillota bacterium]